MNQYFFILGNNANLSLIEIYSVLNGWNYSFDTINETKDYLIIECSTPLNLDELQAQLGGSIKIGEIILSKKTHEIGDSYQELEKYLIENTIEAKRIFFGYNLYSYKKKKELDNLFKWALSFKKQLKELDYGKRRLVQSKEDVLSSVVVKKNKLLDDIGFDLNFFVTNNHLSVGRTRTVQDFELYNKLDYGRPAADSKSGMLPPKLAQIMINLAGNPKNKEDLVLLDPFCGSGTVLMQAISQGFIHIKGSDLSAKAVNDTKDNLAYTSEVLKKEDLDINIQELDVNNLSTGIEESSVDIVVTETYLGPPLTGRETKGQLIKTRNELKELYKSSFDEIYKILKPAAKLIITIPIYKYKDEDINFRIKELIEDSFVEVKIMEEYKDLYTKYNSLIYKRDRQKLWREIFILEKR